MSAYDEINRSPSSRDLLSFGAVVFAGAFAMGSVERFLRHREMLGNGLWIAGAVVFALSFIPPVGRVLYVAWMALGISIGMITTPIVLVVVFTVLITPVALVFRLMHRDAMRRAIEKRTASYWEPYPESMDPGSYLKQF